MTINKILHPPQYAACEPEEARKGKQSCSPCSLRGLPSTLLSCLKPISPGNRRLDSAERRQARLQGSHLVSDSIRARVLQEALSKVLNPAEQPLPVAQHKPLEEIARIAGVAVDQLEFHIKNFMVKRSRDSANPPLLHSLRDADAFMNVLYYLHMLANRHPNEAPWLQHLHSFDTFMTHFCPQAKDQDRAALIGNVGGFILRCRPSMLVPDICLAEFSKQPAAVCSSPGPWVKLPNAWVDVRVIEEAIALARNGIPQKNKLLAHGTGSAALDGIAKSKSILSAASTQQQGGDVRTGEYVTHTLVEKHYDKTPPKGDSNIYASDNGLTAEGYSMQRWFDEVPVTFCISKRKQREHIQVSDPFADIQRMYAGFTIGSTAPLENVVAISAPKENEARIRGWIADHCPHVQFVSYQAARLLADPDMFGLLPKKAGGTAS